MPENIESSDTPNDETKKLFEILMDDFGKTCEENKVEIAVAIAVHPDANEPIVFLRGEVFDAARLLAYVLRRMKANVLEDLNTDIY